MYLQTFLSTLYEPSLEPFLSNLFLLPTIVLLWFDIDNRFGIECYNTCLPSADMTHILFYNINIYTW